MARTRFTNISINLRKQRVPPASVGTGQHLQQNQGMNDITMPLHISNTPQKFNRMLSTAYTG